MSRNYRKDYQLNKRRKLLAKRITLIVMASFIFWVFFSWVNVVFHSLTVGSHNYPFWNFFELFF